MRLVQTSRHICSLAAVLTVAVTASAPATGWAASLPAADGHRPSAGSAPALPGSLSALSWVVADAGSGQVLAQHDAHLRLPPASTLKTLFAVTVLPRLPASRVHLVRESDLAGMGDGSSQVGVVPGLRYATRDLWRGVFLRSGNDAVHVLAAMNGGWQHTAEQMQLTAKRLGASDTHVVSPDGYDAPGQVSSARDLVVFARAGLTDPAFAKYCATSVAEFPSGMDSRGHSGPPFEIQNTNRLLTGTPDVAPYPGLIGVKNGYTTNAGNTLVTAARRQGRTLIVSVMNPQAGSVYEEARALLDWGFTAAGRVKPVAALPPLRARTVSAAGAVHRPAPAPARLAPQMPRTRPMPQAQEDSLPGPGLTATLLGALAALAAAPWFLRRRYRMRIRRSHL
ncbi:D-alanyl-D-alanine carboxypeptidase family protein [Streptomyces beijiangensis]|uniref:D-alanyl-D-alanine carboxypeptidase n=1 Tax=Streptomyces beijiangensis TaxID=163361 RepID=A0A939F9I1_9ACTN|nr:D-alanyl-D-alanine carboxypeptidase [Streptomyces beijiangensis]MBO0514438.1 D-alanyl-D-alanine carboxypeptidase [Streptomyces beijiangensis]